MKFVVFFVNCILMDVLVGYVSYLLLPDKWFFLEFDFCCWRETAVWGNCLINWDLLSRVSVGGLCLVIASSVFESGRDHFPFGRVWITSRQKIIAQMLIQTCFFAENFYFYLRFPFKVSRSWISDLQFRRRVEAWMEEGWIWWISSHLLLVTAVKSLLIGNYVVWNSRKSFVWFSLKIGVL